MIRAFFEKLLRLIFHNLGYKLLSILLAVIVWAIIQGEQVQEVSTEVHVTIHVAPGFGVRGDLQRVKAATIRGPQAWLIEIPQKLAADVFIPPGKLGRYRIRLSKDDVKNLNERLELVVHEPYIDLFVDRLGERTLPVKEVIHGSPPDGLTVEKVNVEPKSVVVKGIRSDLLKLRFVYTEPIDVSGMQESHRNEVKLMNPGFGPDALSTDKAEAFILIGDGKNYRRFAGLPVEVLGSPLKGSVKPLSVNLSVQAAPDVLSRLKRSDIRVSVDANGLAPGRYEREVQVKLPPDVNLIESQPEKVGLTLSKD